MEIKRMNDSSLTIEGVIKTVEDVERIKENIENYIKGQDVTLRIVDSFAIPSALIGYLIKLKTLQKKNLFIKIADEGLYELMKDLNLEQEFHLEKI